MVADGWVTEYVRVEGKSVHLKRSLGGRRVPLVHIHGFGISRAYLMPTARALAGRWLKRRPGPAGLRPQRAADGAASHGWRVALAIRLGTGAAIVATGAIALISTAMHDEHPAIEPVNDVPQAIGGEQSRRGPRAFLPGDPGKPDQAARCRHPGRRRARHRSHHSGRTPGLARQPSVAVASGRPHPGPRYRAVRHHSTGKRCASSRSLRPHRPPGQP
jgi:hypothetical protein